MTHAFHRLTFTLATVGLLGLSACPGDDSSTTSDTNPTTTTGPATGPGTTEAPPDTTTDTPDTTTDEPGTTTETPGTTTDEPGTSGDTTAGETGGELQCADVAMDMDCANADPATCACMGCVDDGMCTEEDDCVCADCAAEDFCGPKACEDDGECHPFIEGCACADCAGHPLCAG